MNQTQIVFRILLQAFHCNPRVHCSCQTTLPLLTNIDLSTIEFTSIMLIIIAQFASRRVRTNHGTYFIIVRYYKLWYKHNAFRLLQYNYVLQKTAAIYI